MGKYTKILSVNLADSSLRMLAELMDTIHIKLRELEKIVIAYYTIAGSVLKDRCLQLPASGCERGTRLETIPSGLLIWAGLKYDIDTTEN